MATRSNVVMVYGDTKVLIYRHWDGYPAANGACILESLLAKDPGDVLCALLGMKDETGTPMYEISHCQHGDIGWLYVLHFTETFDGTKRDMECQISVGKRSPGEAKVPRTVKYSLQEFADLVNVS